MNSDFSDTLCVRKSFPNSLSTRFWQCVLAKAPTELSETPALPNLILDGI